jgi:hypothetical protein
MLTTLKSRAGSSLDDLVHTLPKRYRYLDIPPRYLVFEAMTTLVRWGLAEAYLDGKLLSLGDMEKLETRWETPEGISFYVSKATFEIEDTLGVALDAAPTTIFGETNRDDTSLHVFVMMPFHDELKPIYEGHIRAVTKSLGLHVARADDFFTTGSIMADIWSAINSAAIIIADCTGRNPNVFYEIGLAHARGKATILITQTMDDIPFDLRHLRVITYDFNPHDMDKFDEALGKMISELSRSAPTLPQELLAALMPEETVALDPDGWLGCPFCKKRFSPNDAKRWGDGRHLSCGQRITIAAA